MLTRRRIPMLLGATVLASCTAGGTVDPTAVANDLKNVCGIAVPLTTIAIVVNAAVGATVQTIVDLICSGFKASVAASAKLGAPPLSAGSTHDFVITVNGKTIPITATVVK